MALYFECRINKNVLLHTVFGDYAHCLSIYLCDVTTDEGSTISVDNLKEVGRVQFIK